MVSSQRATWLIGTMTEWLLAALRVHSLDSNPSADRVGHYRQMKPPAPPQLANKAMADAGSSSTAARNRRNSLTARAASPTPPAANEASSSSPAADSDAKPLPPEGDTEKEISRDEYQELINACGLVEISGLREGDLSYVSKIMKEGEEAHRKQYRCVLALSRPLTDSDLATLNGTTELVVHQSTPMRVMHRRTCMVRDRTIHSMSATRLSSRLLQLDCVTQAGTYVKEFCHGDFGRTVPSVGSLLGCSADIMQLDVLDLFDEHL